MRDLSNIRNIKLVGKQTKLPIVLATILSDLNDDKISSKVEHHIWMFRDFMIPLKDLKTHKLFYLNHAYTHIKKVIEVYPYPIVVKTHLLNIIHALYSNKAKELK
jgi:hypothetical protein